ncbi:hypothetical protein, partial [Bacillus proteolyticus]|uniref:hypothetical protein n=1 Tax=Bacillus proteolyticus TaxID=2026192 RepID=UPI003D07239E
MDKCVNLFIYVTPESNTTNDRIDKLIAEAIKIWGKCDIGKIKFINKGVLQIPMDPNRNAEYTFHENEISLVGGTTRDRLPQKVKNLLDTRPNCGETDIAVYFVGGKHTFTDSRIANAFTHVKNEHTEYSIILTESANSRNFAHELGHVLFFRKFDPDPQSPRHWIDDDPDSQRNPSDPAHNTNPSNLMFPGGGTDITSVQCQTAYDSILNKECPPPSIATASRIPEQIDVFWINKNGEVMTNFWSQHWG